MASSTKFELVFSNSAMMPRFPRYRRNHPTLESARKELGRVKEIMLDPNYGVAWAAVDPLIYGPGDMTYTEALAWSNVR